MTNPDQTDPVNLLPPGVLPFEIVLHPAGQMDIHGLEEEAEALAVAQALAQTPLAAPREGAQLWRVRGLLMQGQAQLYEFATSDDGETYEVREFPELPGVPLQGDAAQPNTFDALHYREGRIDLEPDAPDELLDALEDAVRGYHGAGATWAERHAAAGGDPAGVPEARRVKLRLEEVGGAGGLRFVPLPETAEYLSGGAWHPYPGAAAPGALAGGSAGDGPSNPFDLLSSLIDLHSLEAEVYADGRVELMGEGVTEAAGDIVKFTLRDLLGAGDPAEWHTQVGELFELEPGAERPQALRVSLLRQMIDADPQLAGQAMQPVAVSYDGETWHELADPDHEDDEDGPDPRTQET